MNDSLDLHLDRVRERVAALRSAAPEGVEPAWMQAMWEELSSNLEELHVASEELREQADELSATRLLLEAERWNYQVLFDLAPYPYLVTDPLGVIRQANLAAEKLLRVRADFLIGKPLVTFMVPEARGKFRERLDGLAAALEVGEWSFRLQPRGAAAVSAVLRCAPIRDASGALTGLRWSLHDITESELAADALRKAGYFAKATIDALSAHLCVLDENGVILATNKAWRDFAEANPPAASHAEVGANYLQVCNAATGAEEAEAESCAAGIRAVMVGTSDLFSLEYPCHSPTEQRWFVARVTRFPGGGAVVVHENITGRKLAEEEIRRLNADFETRVIERTAQLEMINAELVVANRHKSEFLSGMSHELRTPLNAIVGFTGTLLMKLPGPLNADQEKQLRTVQVSAKHLLSLINDLLDLAKIESGNRGLNIEPVVCAQVIGEVATAMRVLAKAKELEFQVATPASEIILRTDRRALCQILLNLVSNAVKFTERGSVGIALVQRSDEGRRTVEFRITDTGPGVSPGDQARLFGVFARGQEPGSQHAEGSGLGLHLSQNLAALLGGRITLESEPGRGSTFTLRLPQT